MMNSLTEPAAATKPDATASPFAQALERLLVAVAPKARWADWLGINRSALTHWTQDRHVPSPEHLLRIVRIVRDGDGVDEQVILEFSRILEKPASQVSPLSQQFGQSIGAYMLRPLRDMAEAMLATVPPRAQEAVLLTISAKCDTMRGSERAVPSPFDRWVPIPVSAEYTVPSQGMHANPGSSWLRRSVVPPPRVPYPSGTVQSRFASALAGVLSAFGSDADQWGDWLAVDKMTIARWITDDAVPRPEQLYRLVTILRSATYVPRAPLDLFSRVVSEPAWKVSPHSKRLRPTIGVYMLAPLREACFSTLSLVPIRAREVLLEEVTRYCEQVEGERAKWEDLFAASAKLAERRSSDEAVSLVRHISDRVCINISRTQSIAFEIVLAGLPKPRTSLDACRSMLHLADCAPLVRAVKQERYSGALLDWVQSYLLGATHESPEDFAWKRAHGLCWQYARSHAIRSMLSDFAVRCSSSRKVELLLCVELHRRDDRDFRAALRATAAGDPVIQQGDRTRTWRAWFDWSGKSPTDLRLVDGFERGVLVLASTGWLESQRANAVNEGDIRWSVLQQSKTDGVTTVVRANRLPPLPASPEAIEEFEGWFVKAVRELKAVELDSLAGVVEDAYP